MFFQNFLNWLFRNEVFIQNSTQMIIILQIIISKSQIDAYDIDISILMTHAINVTNNTAEFFTSVSIEMSCNKLTWGTLKWKKCTFYNNGNSKQNLNRLFSCLFFYFSTEVSKNGCWCTGEYLHNIRVCITS